MRLTGIRNRAAAGSLADIFNDDELGLLAGVKAKQTAAAPDQHLITLYRDVADFFRRHQKLPAVESSDFDEKRLARKWQAALANLEHREILRQNDDLKLLKTAMPSENLSEQVQSLDDIFSSDALNLLDVGNTDIFQISHIRESHGKTYADEENAVRTVCEDFWRFEAWFKHIHAQLQSGAAHMERLKTETFLQPGDVFLLGGALCYVADYAETEARRSQRANNRLRVIYENGTESDILARSLARAVYKDENGRKIMLHDDAQTAEILTMPSENSLVTGQLYVVKLINPKPELAQFRSLHKIGFTTGTVEERIANAENDIAFLESKVRPVLSFECRNINPHTFERLMHAFFAAQRLNLRLTGKDGRQYVPSEWFDVGLAEIEKAAHLIIKGTISRYRVDNTVGKIVLK